MNSLLIATCILPAKRPHRPTIGPNCFRIIVRSLVCFRNAIERAVRETTSGPCSAVTQQQAYLDTQTVTSPRTS